MKSQYEKFGRYDIIGTDSQDYSNAKHGMPVNEFISGRSHIPLPSDPLNNSLSPKTADNSPGISPITIDLSESSLPNEKK